MRGKPGTNQASTQSRVHICTQSMSLLFCLRERVMLCMLHVHPCRAHPSLWESAIFWLHDFLSGCENTTHSLPHSPQIAHTHWVQVYSPTQSVHSHVHIYTYTGTIPSRGKFSVQPNSGFHLQILSRGGRYRQSVSN